MKNFLTIALIIGCAGFNGCGEPAGSNGKHEKAKAKQMIKPAETNSQYSGIGGMRDFLQCWHNATTEKLQNDKNASAQALKILRESKLQDQSVAVVQLETKLGIQLPLSYRDFLSVGGAVIRYADMLSNEEFEYGFIAPQTVDWFRIRNPMDTGIWSESSESPDGMYYVYSSQQDPAYIRSSYVKKMLVVGEMPGGEFYLLNPLEKTRDNEWETWLLSPHMPGAYRFLSFAELLGQLFLEDTVITTVRPRYSIENFKGTCAEKLFRKQPA